MRRDVVIEVGALGLRLLVGGQAGEFWLGCDVCPLWRLGKIRLGAGRLRGLGVRDAAHLGQNVGHVAGDALAVAVGAVILPGAALAAVDVALAGEVAGGDLGRVVAELAGQILDDAHADTHVVVGVVDALTRLGVPLECGRDDLHAAVGTVDAGAGVGTGAGFLLVDGLDHRLEVVGAFLRNDGRHVRNAALCGGSLGRGV